jgi:phage anti-repressor protein
MNENTTGFINTENKPLPFRKNFKYHARPKAFAGVMKALEDYAANPEIEVIVIDSLSAAFEVLVEEARSLYTNWDIWNFYNKKIGELMKKIKNVNKEVFITAHYEVLNVEGSPERRVKAKGKEWEGVIEKEFTIVLYAEDKWKSDTPEYYFRLAAEGSSAKCPPDLFENNPIRIPNNANDIYKAILNYTS